VFNHDIQEKKEEKNTTTITSKGKWKEGEEERIIQFFLLNDSRGFSCTFLSTVQASDFISLNFNSQAMSEKEQTAMYACQT
jgi:hypothetical protein